MAVNTSILAAREAYSRHYGDFRGVDFSSDHTQVAEGRLAYLANMYKDYRSGQGKAIETIPGFRRRVDLPGKAAVLGIHHFRRRSETGEEAVHILLHAGDRLYRWEGYPRSLNIPAETTVVLEDPTVGEDGLNHFTVTLETGIHAAVVTAIRDSEGADVTEALVAFDSETGTLSLAGQLSVWDVLYVTYMEGVLTEADALFVGMNERPSSSFVFNGRLYLIDGRNYLYYDGEAVHDVLESAYIPTTYINIIPEGENADIGREYEQRNVLQPRFRHTFIADGTVTAFYLNEADLDAVESVTVYGQVLTEGTDYTVDLAAGCVTMTTAPARPETVPGGSYPEFYAGVEITASKAFTSVSGVTEERETISELITECTVVATFDNRVFLSGNPAYPNHVFWCGRNRTGYVDPSYFGILSYVQDGVESAPITGMIPVADTLMVLKADTRQDGSVYFHTPTETGEDLNPKIYPSARGLSGIGCLGAATNFLDDPVFVSRLGLEAIGQLSARYERAVEHRSTLVDARLVNMELSTAVLEEWDGYLLLLCEGRIFMADSRQRYTHETGVMQYEWYYLEDIGVYADQYPAYRFVGEMHDELEGASVTFCPVCGRGGDACTCEAPSAHLRIPLRTATAVYDPVSGETRDLSGQIANEADAEGNVTPIYSEVLSLTAEEETYDVPVLFTVHEVRDRLGASMGFEALLCDRRGDHTGGTFHPARVLRSMEDNLFFGTDHGVICSFNFDRRDEDGAIAPRYYTFDERVIRCGCATKMDSCGVPHMNKNTVKKSTVVKTKSFPSSAAKIKVRTNRVPYRQIARINNTLFSFDEMDFADFSFTSSDQSLFAVKEKEKKWVEKQYYLYSDEYMKPFALFYISFRYTVAGRYKG